MRRVPSEWSARGVDGRALLTPGPPRLGPSLKCKYLTQIRVVAADSGMSFLKCVHATAGDSIHPRRRWSRIAALWSGNSAETRAILPLISLCRILTALSRVAAARSRSLKRRLETDYGFRVFLRYEDADGDFITLSTQNDYNEMLDSESGTVTVRRCVQRRGEWLPHPSIAPRAPRSMSRRRTQSLGQNRQCRTS